MSKQCPVCGASATALDAFCNNCGNSLSRQPQQSDRPYQPRRTPPATPMDKAGRIARTVMGYISFILIGLTVFTLLLSILNFTGGYKVPVTATGSGYGESVNESGSAKLSDILDTKEIDAFGPLAFCARSYGVFNLVLTALSGLMVAKIFQGNRKIRRSVNRYALIGLVGSILFLVFFWVTGIYEMNMLGVTIKIVVHPHFTLWLSAVMFALLYAVNFLAKKKRRR